MGETPPDIAYEQKDAQIIIFDDIKLDYSKEEMYKSLFTSQTSVFMDAWLNCRIDGNRPVVICTNSYECL